MVKWFQISFADAVIYVYDNNSSFVTAETERRAGEVVMYEHQQWNVIKRMFFEVDANGLWWHLYRWECTGKGLGDIKDIADMIVGNQLSSTFFEENKRIFHNFRNSIVRCKCCYWLSRWYSR